MAGGLGDGGVGFVSGGGGSSSSLLLSGRASSTSSDGGNGGCSGTELGCVIGGFGV